MLGVATKRIISPWIVFIPIWALLTLLHLVLRPWTQDEGLYLLASRFLASGDLPTLHFFFEQLPLSPALLAGWQTLAGEGLIPGRLLSWISVVGLGWGIARLFADRGISPWTTMALLSLLTLHPLGWDYLLIVKPQAICLACAFWSFWFLQKPGIRKRGDYFWAGLLLGVAVHCRLLYLFALVPIPYFLRADWKKWGAFAGGFIIPSSLTLFIASQNWEAATFNWITYYQLKSAPTTWAQIKIGLGSLFQTFLKPQWWILFGLWIVGLIENRKTSKSSATWLWVLLGILVTAPTLRLLPIYDEYFLPLLVFSSIGLFGMIGKTPSRIPFPWIAVGCYFLLITPKLAEEVGYLFHRNEPTNSVGNVAKVGRAIRELTSEQDEVLSWWNGYLVQSGRKPLPGFTEGLAVEHLDGKISPSQRRKYHIASVDEVITWVVQQRPKLIVIGPATPSGFESLVAKFYRLERKVGGAVLYVRS